MRHKVATCALSAVVTIMLASCSTPEKNSDGEAIVMGNATPAESPRSGSEDYRVEGIASATDTSVAGDVLAVRTPDGLLVGTQETIAADEAPSLSIPSECGHLSAQGSTFIVACGTTIYSIDAANPTLDNARTTDKPMDTATMTTSGEIVAGSSTSGDVSVFRTSGTVDTFRVSDKTTKIVSVPHNGNPDGVALINKEDTTIHGVDWTSNKPGPTLRVGLGVGSLAAGEDDVVFASDTTGDQLAVYTVSGAIRLHQLHPVDRSPYALAWDKKNKVVWVSSTGTNTLAAYDISSGVPVKKGSLPSAANINSMSARNDGALVTASASEGLSIIPADVVSAALSEG